jgi:hypothetical protein
MDHQGEACHEKKKMELELSKPANASGRKLGIF